jgi:thioesterase domain-containing protein/acyl carrier protein
MGRYLPDGAIEFLGRKDEQVKIRGHRIEPGEIDAILRQHPDVNDVLTLAREDTPGDKRLVAYVVARSPSASAADLRAFLKRRIPNYMIPAHMVLLQRLPFTTNGKVDRARLPSPALEPGRPTRHFPTPGDLLEYQLQQIWEDVLGVRPVSVTDDFFELGGHSLLAVRLLMAIEATTGRSVPLASLFEGATVQRVARILREESAGTSVPVTTFHKDGSRPPFFFLHGDYTGGGFYCGNLARCLGSDQPFHALHAHGLDGRGIPETIEAMAADHLATMLAIQPHGPYRIGGYCNGGLIAFEIARRLQAAGEQVALLAVFDADARNAQFAIRLMCWLLHRLAAVGGLTSQEARACFIRARRYTVALGQRVHRSRVRLGRLCRREGDAWMKLTTMIRNCFSGPKARSTHSFHEIYDRAVAAYVPGVYSGRVILFRTNSDEGLPRDLWWGLVAAGVEIHDIPGDHATSITRHIQILGEELRACLQNS